MRNQETILRRIARGFAVALVLGAPLPAVAAPTAGGPLAALRQLDDTLLAHGVHVRLALVNNFAANPVGGERQGAGVAGGVVFGADFHLGRIVGWQGATVHVTFAQYWGRNLSGDFIGTANKAQDYNYPFKQFELAQFSLEQKLDSGRLDLLVGRINATAHFARTPYGCRFENALDCPLTLTDITGEFTGFPYVNWGGVVRYQASPGLGLKAGAFEINHTRVHNAGFEWSTKDATGVIVPAELDFSAGRGGGYARHAAIGGWYNSDPYIDPFLNARGKPRAFVPGKPLLYEGGRGGAFAEADAVVWRGGAKSGRNLALFGVAAAPFDARETYVFQGVLGAAWTGPFATRPHDQFNLIGSYIKFSGAEIGYLDDLLIKHGTRRGLSADQFLFEANYAVRLRPGLFVVPDVQYIVNPDTAADPGARFVPKNVLVVGARVMVLVH